MYKKMAGYKKGMRNGIAMLIFYILLLALTLCIGILFEQNFVYLVSALCVVMIFWVIKQIKRISNNYIEMEKNTAIAKQRIKQYSEMLDENAFVVSKHLSAFGYNFIEYRNDFSAPDNMHLWVDEQNKKLAFAELLENHFKIFNYSDIIDAKIIKQTKQAGMREMLTLLVVQFTLKGDDFMYGFPVNDNQGFYTDTQEFTNIIDQAEELLALLKSFMHTI